MRSASEPLQPVAWVNPSEPPLTLLIAPVPAPRMSKQDAWESTRSQAMTRYVRYGEELRKRTALRDMLERGPVKIDFYLPLPKSWSESKRKEHLGMPHQEKPDKDNLEKGLLDAVFYRVKGGDKHIWCNMVSKRWDLEGWIQVRPLIVNAGCVFDVEEAQGKHGKEQEE